MRTLTCVSAALFWLSAGSGGAAWAAEDPRDAPVVSAMVKQTLEFERTGTDLPWSNPETGSRGVIRVERTYYLDPNTPCRDYTRTTDRPGGERITARGTGCRMADGRWFLDEALGRGVAPASKTPPAAAEVPEGRRDETLPPPDSAPAPDAPAASSTPASAAEVPAPPMTAPVAEAPALPAPTGEDAPAAVVWDKPAGETTAELGAPAPPPAKPKVRAPDYTLPSRSAP
jgi:surface antigen